MLTESTIASLERGREKMEALLTGWTQLAVEAERNGDVKLQGITTRGTDIALFRVLLGEAGTSPYIANPQTFVRTLFHIADKAELEYGRDASLAKQTRDCLFNLMRGLGAADADRIVTALVDIMEATDVLDAKLRQLRDEYEAHTKGGE